MKSLKTLVLLLALTSLPWAQTSTPDSSKPAAQSTAKTECPCCQKMAEGKEGKSCCAHHDMAAKDGKAMSCCSGKDAKSCMGKDGKSCMKGDKDQMAACGKEDCCGSAGCMKDGDKSTMACCSGDCGMKHDAQPDAMK